MKLNLINRPFRYFLHGAKWLAGLLLFCTGLTCRTGSTAEISESVAVALEWNNFLLQAEMQTEGYRAPVASRTYGYVGLAAYEAALPGLSGEFQSLSGWFPGLGLPDPPAKDHFDIAISINECYSSLLRKFFVSAPETISGRISDITENWYQRLDPGTDTTALRISKIYGQEVAEAVFAWSMTDSLGYGANHHNYDRNYVPPVGVGKWVTSADFPMPALLPYWGKVRPFIIQTENYLAREPPPYATETYSIYYVQALEMISLNKPLSAENQWIAEFWNDDRPGLTFTPAGHWLAITNQVIAKEAPSIEKTMETYLKLGFVLADAMIACWYSKYEYNLERPESYIQKVINPAWRPYTPSPSFPSYPSGHAMIGAAASEVLSSMYGSEYHMIDLSHNGLEAFSVRPREFNSFQEMARESALSRILMGVHWRLDAEEGLRLGALIGKKVNNLPIEDKLTQ